MKNSLPNKIDYQNNNDQKYTTGNKIQKTTNINILLNRVRQDKNNKLKKKIIFLISIIGILSFISILVFAN